MRGVLAETRATPAAGTAPGLAPMNAGPIPVEISARHVHLSTADAINLFGEALRPHKPLSQPGQFLSTQRVRLIGPKGVMDNVAVLGPVRDVSQVEISKTDARALGITRPYAKAATLRAPPAHPGLGHGPCGAGIWRHRGFAPYPHAHGRRRPLRPQR